MSNQTKVLQSRKRSLNQRARRAGRPGRVTAEELAVLVARNESKCQWCSIPLDYSRLLLAHPLPPGAATFDHLLDLYHGGDGSISNLTTSCHACNTIRQWMSNGKRGDRLTACAGRFGRRWVLVASQLDGAR